MSGSGYVPRAVMYAYPWDLIDEGIDSAIENLKARGIDAVQIPAAYHVGTYVSPRNPVRVVHFGEQGALHFEPSPGFFKATRVRPFISDGVRQDQGLGSILEPLAAAGLSRIVWFVFLYNHNLAQANPELAVENVFGNHNGAQLCPINPDVQSYVIALSRELSGNLPAEGMVAESLSFLPYDYGFLNAKTAVNPSPPTRFLLGTCWCSSCRKVGEDEGIDVQSLRRRVADQVRGSLNAEPGRETEDGAMDLSPADHLAPDLHAYLNRKRDHVTELHREVLRTAWKMELRTGSTTAEQHKVALETGVDITSVEGLVSEARLPVGPGTTVTSLTATLSLLEARLPHTEHFYALFQPGQFNDEEDFQKKIEMCDEVGINRFRFYNYGLLSRVHMNWLMNAQSAWRQ